MAICCLSAKVVNRSAPVVFQHHRGATEGDEMSDHEEALLEAAEILEQPPGIVLLAIGTYLHAMGRRDWFLIKEGQMIEPAYLPSGVMAVDNLMSRPDPTVKYHGKPRPLVRALISRLVRLCQA